MALVSSIMSKDPAVTRPDESVVDAAARMRDRRVGSLVVVEGGAIRGMIEERDLVARVVAEGRDAAKLRVSEVATAVREVEPAMHVTRCAELMRESGTRHVAVVDGGKLVGVLSATDLFREMAEGLERFLDEKGYLREISEGADPYDHVGGSYGR